MDSADLFLLIWIGLCLLMLFYLFACNRGYKKGLDLTDRYIKSLKEENRLLRKHVKEAEIKEQIKRK